VKLSGKAKAVVAAIGTFVTVLGTVLADNVVAADETGQLIVGLVGLVVTVYGVWRVPNKDVKP